MMNLSLLNSDGIHLLFCLLSWTAHTSLSDVITVPERQIAILPCSAALAALRTHAKPTLLRWFHARYHKPIYTLDVRLTNQLSGSLNHSTFDAKHFPSPDFDGRLYLELHSTPLALRIDPVLYEDNGKFTCRIDFKARRSVLSSVILQVIVPPQEVLIHDQNGRKLKGVIGPFNLGEAFIITCEAQGGKPPPLLSWSGSFDNSSGDFKVNISKYSSSILIPCLKRTYQWMHFTCTAKNSNITVPKSLTVTLEIKLPPITVEIDRNLEPPLVESQNLIVTCRSNGSHPKSHIRWCIDGRSVTSKEVISDGGNIVTSYHRRKVTASDNEKALECFVSNPSIPSFIMKRSYTMVVYYKPKVKIRLLNSSTNTIIEGRPATIMCEVVSNPKVYQKTWFFKGKTMSNTSFMLNRDGNVLISSINRSQIGTYTCKVTNLEGSSSSSIYLDVKYTPVCKQIEISAKYHGRQGRGDISNVTCSLYASPGNVTFYWMARNSSSNHSWSTGGDSHAEVWREAELIELLCWGENEIGLQRMPCRIKIPQGGGSIYHFNIVVIVCFTVTFSSIVLFVTIKKLLLKNGTSSSSVQRRKNNDNGCSQIINNCVKSAGTPTENECMATLLIADQTRSGSNKERDQRKMFSLEEKESFESLLEARVALRNTSNDRTRRIKSSQF